VPWKPSDVWTVSVRCCARCCTRSDSQGAFRRQQACLAFLDQLRPLWTIDLLVDDNDRDLGT